MGANSYTTIKCAGVFLGTSYIALLACFLPWTVFRRTKEKKGELGARQKSGMTGRLGLYK